MSTNSNGNGTTGDDEYSNLVKTADDDGENIPLLSPWSDGTNIRNNASTAMGAGVPSGSNDVGPSGDDGDLNRVETVDDDNAPGLMDRIGGSNDTSTAMDTDADADGHFKGYGKDNQGGHAAC